MPTCNPTTLLSSGAAFQALDAREQQIVIAQLLCDISGSLVGPTGGVFTNKVILGGDVDLGEGPTVGFCAGSPEAAVTATPGSIRLRTDGGASTTLYVKTSGTGNTGWTAK